MATPKKNDSRKRGGKAMPQAPQSAKADFNSTTHPLLFLAALIAGLLLLAALMRYENGQPFFGSESCLKDFVVTTEPNLSNPMGKLGATIAVIAFNFLGLAAFMLPVFLFLYAYYMARFRADISLLWKTFLMALALCSGATLLEIFPKDLVGFNPDVYPPDPYMPPLGGPGGRLGKFLFNDVFVPVVGTAGTVVSLFFVYAFCVLGLIVSAPQRTIARGVNAIFAGVRRYLEHRRQWREHLALRREAQRQAMLAAQEQLRKNREAAEKEAADADAEKNEEKEDDESPMPIDEFAASAPESRTGIDVEDEDFSGVPVADDAFPQDASPALEELPSDAALTPIDFGASEKTTETDEAEEPEKDAAVPAGTLKIVAAETLERADDADAVSVRGDYVFPPLDLLAAPKADAPEQSEDYEARGQIIINELANFKCPATLSSAQVGPTITRYEIKPGAGVKAERILNLQNNVAMALQAQSARLASVPEHGTIGIEVPNKRPKSVLIREVLESKAWHENRMEIPAVLGKDVTGRPVLIDLAKMPHGLIAGSSGSGKSVCLNGIITSILYHASPEEVRLVMVDPKVVELKVYNDAPHMLIPVITDMKRAPGALKWLIDEMERRYQLLEEAGVRNIVGYNAKIEKDKAEAARLAELAAASENEDAFTGVQNLSPENSAEENAVPAALSVPRDEGVLDEWRGRKKMSYIVCVIDEFADIMAQNAAEIESGVARLTAKARAAGIHLILATQRPDAKTVTGLIKANLGTRIALRVTSGTNSRIILDEVGAETLIGKGDMLVLGPGSPFPQRAQGVWVSEEEIESIVKFLAEKNGKPKYADDVTSAIDSYAAEDEEGDAAGNGVSDSRDELVGKAWDVIRTTKRASISNLQRRLGIGYNRAAKIIDILEEQGKVGPDLGPNKQREIYE